MDIVWCLHNFWPSFVSKESVRSYPGIGQVAVAIDCLFLERASSKEEKAAVLKKIEMR